MGKLNIELLKDTGKPKFRIWWCGTKDKWIFKILSFTTLYVSWGYCNG